MTPSNTIDISRVRMSLPDLAATTVLRPPGDIERARRAEPPHASMSVRGCLKTVPSCTGRALPSFV
jgi:hypothetical protein